MTDLELTKWVQRGCQRRAVFQALNRPLTSSEMWRIAKRSAEKIQLRDVWLIVKQFETRGLGVRISPLLTKGNVYALTVLGRKIFLETFGVEAGALPSRIHWPSYAMVVRAKVRCLVLKEIGARHVLANKKKTASRIRKNLLETYPLGLNPVLRALKELCALELIRADFDPLLDKKAYRLTRRGKKILTLLSVSGGGSYSLAP